MTTEVPDDDLGSFFKRPLEIYSGSWSTTVRLFEELDPWSLYLENSRVINRLSNYRNLKGNLCVKFMLNGNGFYYGRVLVHYLPMETSDDFSIVRGLTGNVDLVEGSQRPHIFLNPTTSEGGTLYLPFFWDKDSLSIPDADWREMGKLYLSELNNLRTANGATEPLTITAFAWMENVELSVPTAADAGGLVPQSGMEKKGKKKTKVTQNKNSSADEYGEGIISHPASVIASISGMLANAPYIGPFAKATEIGASGIANIAKLFGYSRPVAVENIHRYTPRYVPELATINTEDTSAKLSTDIKQELTIDNRVVGAGPCDEMGIASIASRESFLTDFLVNTSQGVGNRVFTMGVTPTIFRAFDGGGGAPIEYHTPACAFAALPFKYWRGSMKVRFQVVASSFHKGRFKVQWDPSGYTSTESNVQFTHIVDIADDKDFTMEIGWGRELGWLSTQSNKVTASDYYNNGDNGTITFDPATMNGQLTVTILNQVSTPSEGGETIAINVFIAMDDDFEVAVPNFILHDVVRPPDVVPPGPPLVPQSGMENETSQEAESSPPVGLSDGDDLIAFGQTKNQDNSLLVYHGEAIGSFRSLLKRYNCLGSFNFTVGAGGAGDFGRCNVNLPLYPPYPGVGDGSVWPSGGGSSNTNRLTLFSYLAPAFAAVRGGMRYKLIALDTDGIGRIMSTELRTVPGGYGNPSSSDIAEPYYGGSSLGQTGTAMTITTRNPVLEVEVPYQTNYRFNRIRTQTYDNDVVRNRQWQTLLYGGDGEVLVDYWCATAEDFSFGFFVNAPILY